MNEKKIAIMGLGYVGLPLAVNLSSHFEIKGFDISNKRVIDLKKGIDETLEVKNSQLQKALKKNLQITNNLDDISSCNIFIVTVPTPIDKNKDPDFKPLLDVCKKISKLLKNGDIIAFESTVYPGATEEICAKELEKNKRSLKSGVDFFLGYSPERVNPGDKKRTIDKINKVISGQNKKVETILFDIYSKLTEGEIFLAKNIKVAEASKVIENAQRDINIAFINEVAKICSKLNISIYDVLDASNTKWNFLPFLPGLVGGHCIGVDPYYLSHKAKELKVDPEVILSGRRTNDNMPKFIFKEIQKRLKKKANILFLGVTFKEDVPDLRNSKAIELVSFFRQPKFDVFINDPFINDDAYIKYKDLIEKSFDAIILTVPHTFYKEKFLHIKKLLKKDGILFDIKGIFRNKNMKNYWSL